MVDKAKQSKPKTETHVVETKDGPVRITQPAGKKHHAVQIVMESDDLVREQVGGFTNFLREYAVVGLAVGFIIGQQANAVVKQLVDSFIQPWLQVLFGTGLKSMKSTFHHGFTPVIFPWGAFVYAFIQFVSVAVIIYIVFKILRLDKLKKQKEEDKKAQKKK